MTYANGNKDEKIDRMRTALYFYAIEAEALARYMAEGKENKADAILASVTVLALDGGKRAREAIG